MANTTAPGVDFGFSQIGYTNGASAVYLGNGWMLSAYHVAGDGAWAGSVALNGVGYEAVPGSGVRLKNADGSEADLTLFRLSTVPQNLTGALISAASLQADTAVVMAGFGVDRADEPSYAGSQGGGGYFGYQLLNTHRLHWGTNATELINGAVTQPLADGFGVTQMFSTAFDETNGEAQAAVGDSGGGVFRWVDDHFELCGIMLAIDTYPGQPADFAAYGNYTFAADLSAYREQILKVVPEPDTGVMLGVGAGFLACCRARGRKRFFRRAA